MFTQVVAALLCPDVYIVSPYEYAIALAENAVTNGVDLRLKHEVFDIQCIAENLFRVTTRHEKFQGRWEQRTRRPTDLSMIGGSKMRVDSV